MNRIFKKVWSKVRGCYVAVSEATGCKQSHKLGKAALIVGAIATSSVVSASTIELSSGSHQYGDLVGNDKIILHHLVDKVVIKSIYSPNGTLQTQNGRLPNISDEDWKNNRYNVDYGVYTHAAELTVNGDVNIGSADLGGKTTFNGNVKVNGTVTRKQIEDNSYIQGTNLGYRNVANGVFWTGFSQDLGGVVVNGNLTASLVQCGGHVAHKISEFNKNNGYSVGGLTINGNMNADWLIVDIATPGQKIYDNWSDYVEINGTAHIRQDVFMGGKLKVKKLIVDGTFYNSFGEYRHYDEAGGSNGESYPGEFGKPGLPEEYIGSTIEHLDAQKIVNANNLFVGTLANTRGQTYTQTYGTIKVTNNWFADSTINLSGGVIDEQFLGQAHNLGQGNHYNVTGGTLKVGDLRGDSTIVLSDKGTIETKIESVFENIDGIADPAGLNTIRLNASVPEEVQKTITDIFKKYVPGDVIQNVMDRVTLQGGKILISGVNITETQRDDLTKAFKERFGSSTTIEFQGNIAGVSKDDILNTAKVNELHKANIGLSGVIYVDRKLEGENGAVVIGNNGVLNSVGFAGINQATKIDVKDGKELVLVGANGDASYALTSVGSTITGEGAKLRLGSLGLKNAANWKGTTKSIDLVNGGDLQVVAGNYTTNGLTATGAGATVAVNQDATYRVTGTTNMGVDSELTNEGNLTLHRLTGTGSTITNNRNLTIENGIDISGELINNDKLKVTGDTSITSGFGSFTNTGNAILAGNLTIEGNLTNALGAVLDTKTMTVVGKIKNNGLIKASDNSTVEGTLTNTGTINLFDKNMEIGANGRLDNTGLNHSITGVGTITVNGLLTNVKKADFSGNVMNVADATGRIQNASTMNLKTVNLTNGATFENTGKLASDTKAKANASTLVLNIDGKSSFTNSGELHADNIDVKGQLINTGTVIANTQTVNGFVQNGTPVQGTLFFAAPKRATDITGTKNILSGNGYTNNGDALWGTANISGQLTNNAGGVITIGPNQYFPNGTGLNNTGTISNEGELKLVGSMDNKANINGNGTLIFASDTTRPNVFTNTGTINAGTLTADGITYTQTGGSITAKNGWFANSQINLTKGQMTHDGLGVGNTYKIGDGKSSTDVAHANFGKLTSDSTVEILQGGVLSAKVIQLNGSKANTIQLMGGKLNTTLDQIFSNVSKDALDIDAQNPQDLVDLSGVDIITSVGNIKSEVSTGINFGWGTVAFDDKAYSVALAADVLQKLDADDADPLGHEGALEVTFNGVANSKFDVDLAQRVKANKKNGALTFATFARETLTNEMASSNFKKLYVGNKTSAPKDANVLDTSIGFKQVVGVNGGMTVADGHQFVLVGEVQSLNNHNYALLDGNLTVAGKGSMVTLGSYGTNEETEGKLLDIALNDGGVIRVRHGDFVGQNLTNHGGVLYIGGDGRTTVNGSLLNADKDSSLTLNQYVAEANSNLVNFGTFTVGTLTGTAGNLTNYGTLTATNATLAQNHKNLGTETVDLLNMTGGALTNGDKDHQKASLTVKQDLTATNGDITNHGTVTIAGNFGAHQSTISNSGTINLDSLDLDGGSITNAANGYINIAGKNDVSSITGTVENAGDMSFEGVNPVSIGKGGKLHNTGGLSFNTWVTVANGELHQSSNTELFAKNLTVNDGKVKVDLNKIIEGETFTANGSTADTVLAENSGKLEFNKIDLNMGTINGTGTLGSIGSNITIAKDGVVVQKNLLGQTLTNDGRITVTDMTVATTTNKGQLTVNGSMSGDATNAGTLTLNQTTIAGTLNNTGKLVGTGTVTVNGTLTHASATEAKVENLTVNQGTVTIEDGKAMTGTGTLAMADSSSSLTNQGTLTFKDVNIANGTLSGNGSLLASKGAIALGKHGSIEQNRVEAGTLTNAGSVTTNDLVITTATNEANAHLTVNKTLSGNVTNKGDLALNKATYQNGTITNTGTIVGTSVTLDGAINSTGSVTLNDGMINNSSITGTGTLTLAQSGVSTQDFVNKGTINVGTLNADDITFTQNGGSIQATNGWFTNSRVNLVNGQMSHADMGIGNQYVIGDGTSTQDVAHATFDTVTSDSTVQLVAGGHLTANRIELNGIADTIRIEGGTLATTLDQIFDNVSHQALDIDAINPDDLVDLAGANVITGVGSINKNVSTGINFGWGTVAFNDKAFSVALATDVLDKINADDVDPEGHANGMEVTFNGVASSKFDVDLANKIKASKSDGSPTFATFARETLTNTAAGSSFDKLFVGNKNGAPTDANVLDNSIGFKQIVGATGGVTIADAHHLVLVGEVQSKGDKNYQIVDGDLDVRGQGSMLTLGSYGTNERTNGHVQNLAMADGGVIRVRHGDFVGQDLTNAGGVLYIGGDGKTTVNGSLLQSDTTASLTLNSYTAEANSDAVNFGVLTIKTLNGKAGSLKNVGIMNVTDAVLAMNHTNLGTENIDNLTITGGTFTNGDADHAQAMTNVANDMTVSGGQVTNANGAIAVGGTVHVSAGAVVNKATMVADALDMTGGELRVEDKGTLTVSNTKTASTIAGTLENAGTVKINGSKPLTIAQNGNVHNTGTMTIKPTINLEGGVLHQSSAKDLEVTTITATNGHVKTDANTTIKGNTFTGNATLATGVVAENEGTLDFATITLEQGSITGTGTLGTDRSTINVAANGKVEQGAIVGTTLANQGNVTTGDLTVTTTTNEADLTVNGKVNGKVDNLANGTLTLAGASLESGTVKNLGTLKGTGTVTVAGGTLLQSSNTATAFENLTVNKGKVNVEAGKTLAGSGLFLVQGTNDLVTNDGTIHFANINVAEGNITGKGTLGNDTSKLVVSATGSVNQNHVNVDTLSNEGSVVTNNLTIKTQGSNLAAGNLTITGTHNGNLANQGTLNLTGSTLASGTITNTGIVVGTGNVTIAGGTLQQTSDKAATFENLAVNSGKLVVDAHKTVNGSGMLTVNGKGDLVKNDGLLAFADITVNEGNLVGTGTLGSQTSDVTIKNNGSINQSSIIANNLSNEGSVTTNDLTLEALGANKATGTLTVTGTMKGDLSNAGTLNLNGSTLASGTITNTGIVVGTGNVTMAGGTLHQTSDKAATFEDLTINSGLLDIDANKTVNGTGTLTVNGMGNLITNDGLLAFADINVTQGNVVGNGTFGSQTSDVTIGNKGSVNQSSVIANNLSNEGSIVTNDLTIKTQGTNAANGTLTINGSHNGNLANQGTLNLNGSTLASGTITNTGTVVGTGHVTIAGGTFHQSSNTAATFEDLTVNAGSLTVDTDKTVTGNDLVVDGTGELVKNDGTLNFADATIAQGSVIGTGTLGSNQSNLTVEAQGVVTQGSILANNIVNKGSITANDNLNVTGKLDNDKTLIANGDADITNLHNKGNATFNQGVTLDGINTSTGSLSVAGKPLDLAQTGSILVSGGSLEANAGSNIAGKLDIDAGDVTLNGVTQVAGSITNKGGNLNIADLNLANGGSLTSKADTTIDSLTTVAGSSITMTGGSLHFGDLNGATNTTFTQVDGTITADKGWFQDSTLNFEGGKFDASIIKDKDGNDSGMLGHNTVNIGKVGLPNVVGPDSDLPSADKINWKDPYVVVKVDKVNSETIINIGAGGVLDVNKIELDPSKGNTITVGSEGGLQTSLDQIFDKVSTTVVKVDAVNPETGKVDLVTDVVASTKVDAMKDTIKNGVTFEKGSMIAFDDNDWTVDLVVSVENAFQVAGVDGVEKHYLGDMVGDFTIDTATELVEEQKKLQNQGFFTPGIVFDNTTLHNVVANGLESNSLVIGQGDSSTSHVIDTSIGFKDVAHADNVTINNKHEFVLVGSTMPEGFDWTKDYGDGNKFLKDAADGGSINVADGTLTLGSWGVEKPTVGWVNSAQLGEDGKLVTKNGEFAVWEIEAGSGKIDVTEGSILHTNTITTTDGADIHVGGGLTVAENMVMNGNIEVGKKGMASYKDLTVNGGNVVNKGTEIGQNLVIGADSTHTNTGTSIWENADFIGNGSNGTDIPEDGLTGNKEGFTSDAIIQIGSDAGDNHLNFGGDYANNGILNAGKVENTTVAGNLTNKGQAQYQDMTINKNGSSLNVGLEKGQDLVVNGSHTNKGTSIWNGSVTVNGTGTNGDALPEGVTGNDEDFKSDVVTVIGSKDNQNDKFDVNGSYKNNGIIDAEDVEKTTVAGNLTNNGQALYEDMDIIGGTSVNKGFEQGNDLFVDATGTHTNTGTSIWNGNVTIEGTGTNGADTGAKPGYNPDFKSDSVIVIGSAEGTNDQFNVNGSYTNNGILNATDVEKTTVGGDLTNNGHAQYQDMDIIAGNSVNNNFERGEDLFVDANSTHTNNGLSIWNGNVTIEGSGTNGTDTGAKPGFDPDFKSDVTIQLGSDKTEDKFEIGDNGDYTNNGNLNASEVEDTIVKGELTNNGHGEYQDMTIVGGNSVNNNFERGEDLVVDANSSHTNNGLSIWNGVTIEGTGSNGAELPEGVTGNSSDFKPDAFIEIGSKDPNVEDNFDIKGDYTNNGSLNAENVETTIVAGNLTNNGQSKYDDMTVEQGGKSENIGFEKGDILVVEGEHTNTGTSIWNEVVIDKNGSGSNGKDSFLEIGDNKDGGDLDDHFVIGGNFTNNGTIDATKTEDTIVDGTLTNKGEANYNDMDINNGGTSKNEVYEKGDILEVNKGGSWENNGESHWNNIHGNGGNLTNKGEVETDKIVIDGGYFDNTGKIETGELELNDGVLDLGKGELNAQNSTINGGDLVVGNHEPLANENRVDYDTTTKKPINGHIWVIGNGDISFGKDADKFADKIHAPDIPKAPNRITVTETVTIGEKGSLAIGSDVWTDRDNHKDVGDGNLFFGKDSTTVVDIMGFGHDKPVFEGTKPGATVTVEEGAQLHLGTITESGDYILTDKFDTSINIVDGEWVGGWDDEDIHAFNQDASGLEWDLSLKWDDTKIWVEARLEDIRNKYPDIVIPNNVNDQLEDCRSAGSADKVLTCTIIKSPDLTNDEKTKIINSVAEIGFAAGAMATAFNDANTTADALENRLSMKMDAFYGDARMREAEKGHTLWVDVIGGKQKADSYKATGNISNGFDADSFGFIMGADHKLAGKDIIVGGAFSYLDGSVDSTGDLLATKSENMSYGLHAYGAWKPTDKTNVIGTLSYLHHNAEATQALPIAFKEATADIDSDLITLGVRGERHFDLTDRVKLIPHVGLRAVYAMGGNYDTKLDGQDAYQNDADATLTFQAPIGIAARADFATAKGWTIVPQADLTVIPVFGDTSQKVDVHGVSTTATDTIEGDFTSSYITQVNFGVQATNAKDLTVGVRYGLNAGGDGKQDHSFKLEVRKSF